MTDAEWTVFLDRITPAERLIAQSVLARIERVLERSRSQWITEREAIERRSTTNTQRSADAHLRIDRLTDRVDRLDDHFLDGGMIAQLMDAVHQIAVEVEQLKERATGDGSD